MHVQYRSTTIHYFLRSVWSAEQKQSYNTWYIILYISRYVHNITQCLHILTTIYWRDKSRRLFILLLLRIHANISLGPYTTWLWVNYFIASWAAVLMGRPLARAWKRRGYNRSYKSQQLIQDVPWGFLNVKLTYFRCLRLVHIHIGTIIICTIMYIFNNPIQRVAWCVFRSILYNIYHLCRLATYTYTACAVSHLPHGNHDITILYYTYIHIIYAVYTEV